jgi:hypothetical protein
VLEDPDSFLVEMLVAWRVDSAPSPRSGLVRKRKLEKARSSAASPRNSSRLYEEQGTAAAPQPSADWCISRCSMSAAASVRSTMNRGGDSAMGLSVARVGAHRPAALLRVALHLHRTLDLPGFWV